MKHGKGKGMMGPSEASKNKAGGKAHKPVKGPSEMKDGMKASLGKKAKHTAHDYMQGHKDAGYMGKDLEHIKKGGRLLEKVGAGEFGGPRYGDGDGDEAQSEKATKSKKNMRG